MEASSASPRTGNVEFKLFWQGDKECAMDHVKDWEIKIINIIFKGVATISASLPQETLTNKAVQLKMTSSGGEINVTRDSISYPPEIAKTIKIKVKIFENNQDTTVGKDDLAPLRFFHSGAWAVSIKEKPDFKAGECYGIYVEHTVVRTVEKIDEKIEARIRLEGSPTMRSSNYKPEEKEELVQSEKKKPEDKKCLVS